MLTDAWNLFAKYDGNAKIQQRQFRYYQGGLLLLGVLATLLAILATQLTEATIKNVSVPAFQSAVGFLVREAGPEKRNVLQIALVIVTALSSGLLAVLNRNRHGEKWLLLRAGAQSVMREIYCWRTQAGAYRDKPDTSLLYHKLNDIAKGLEQIVLHEVTVPPLLSQSEAAQTAHSAQTNNSPTDHSQTDDKQSLLTAEQYIRFRVRDQADFYKSRILRLNRQAQALHLISIVASVFGTILAVLGKAAWVPLTTALTAACVSHLQQRQTEATLVQYNLSYNSLMRLEMWWRGELSEAERALPANVDKLVASTEEILEAELTSWTQKLNAAMAKLYTSVSPEIEKAPASAVSLEKEKEKTPGAVLPRETSADHSPASAVVSSYPAVSAPAAKGGDGD